MANSPEKFSLAARLKSFHYAFDGIIELLRSQHNAWIHAAATIIVIIAGCLVGVNRIEWCFLVLAIVMVWVAEAFNSALEYSCDLHSTEFHPLIKKVKDLAAGAVLISAIGALLIGLLVFTPYFLP